MNVSKPWINRTIFVLSLLGIVMAVYVLQSFVRQAPIVCVSNGCEIVRKHPASYPFGIPVPAFGLVGYSILALSAFLKTLERGKKWQSTLTKIMLGVALFGVGFVSWFTYTEITIIKGICMWCAISAVNMVIIFALLMKEPKV
ncbi:MAG: vitamin K epoxide reductase family protein [Patescibacteria group bacterium]